LEDVEVPLTIARVSADADLDYMVEAFDELYAAINRPVAQYREAGHTITELGLIAKADKIKPTLKQRPLGGAEPPAEAYKGSRQMYYGGTWHDARLWEMDLLRPGNRVDGPAVIEHPATTLVIPQGDHIWVDEW